MLLQGEISDGQPDDQAQHKDRYAGEKEGKMRVRILDPECLVNIPTADIKGKIPFYKPGYPHQQDRTHGIENIALLLQIAGIEELDISIHDQAIKKDSIKRINPRASPTTLSHHKIRAT